jgi:hypothetical protein
MTCISTTLAVQPEAVIARQSARTVKISRAMNLPFKHTRRAQQVSPADYLTKIRCALEPTETVAGRWESLPVGSLAQVQKPKRDYGKIVRGMHFPQAVA